MTHRPTDQDLIEDTAANHGWTRHYQLPNPEYRKDGQRIAVDFSDAGRISMLRINHKTVEKDRRAAALTTLKSDSINPA